MWCACAARADVAAEGLTASAQLGVGVDDGDGVLAAAGSVGLAFEPVAVRLRLGGFFRALDVAPSAPPGACRFVQCSVWLGPTGQLSSTALSRILDDARLFWPGDVLYARAGLLVLTLGQGQLVQRLTTAASADISISGVYVELNLPIKRAQLQVLTTSVFAPLDVVAVRAALQPLDNEAQGAGARLLSRAQLAVEAAADATALQPVIAAALTLAWPLLDEPGALQLSPWLGASALRGLPASTPWPAGGAQAGVKAALHAAGVVVHADANLGLNQRGHRAAPFSSLYLLDREVALRAAPAPNAFSRHGINSDDAPAGVSGTIAIDATLWQACTVRARWRFDPAAQRDELEVGGDLQLSTVDVSARIMQRAFTAPRDMLDLGARTFVVAQASWRFFGPLSAYLRAQHGVRVVPQPHVATDVIVGVAASVVLSPAW